MKYIVIITSAMQTRYEWGNCKSFFTAALEAPLANWMPTKRARRFQLLSAFAPLSFSLWPICHLLRTCATLIVF